MTFNPHIHHRRWIRLRGYDYALPGAYSVTLCVQGGECLFGEIVGGAMVMNENGGVVADAWEWLASRYEHVDLDEWIVMPNHLHRILVISDRGSSRTAPTCTGDSRIAPTATKPLGSLLGAFKTVSTKRINQIRNMPAARLWQRNYWEHVIRKTPNYLGFGNTFGTTAPMGHGSALPNHPPAGHTPFESQSWIMAMRHG